MNNLVYLLVPVGVVAIVSTALYAVPPAPPEPKLFILSAIPESPSQLDPNTTVFIEKAAVIGGITNQWVPRTNFPANLTNVLILEDADMAVFRGFESNSVYGAGDFFGLVLKPAAPGNRKLGLRVAP
jgi:hypothetical protein